MPSIYKARWRNALKKAAKINRLIRKGYHVFAGGIPIDPGCRWKLNGKELLFHIGTHTSILYYRDDAEWDHGRYQTIKEYNRDLNDQIAIYKPSSKVKI